MKKLLFLLSVLMVSVAGICADEPVFTKATDLYYGTEFSKQYNHQVWFTTEGLTYDPVNSEIEGTDGVAMRLDLMCPSATNIAGTYEIVGPAYADAPYKMNKKYTYWSTFVEGGFSDKKLTVGTCTIVCTSRETYTVTYNVQEIDNGPTHSGTIKDIRISAVKNSDGKPYTLVPTCTNAAPESDPDPDPDPDPDLQAIDAARAESVGAARKVLENGILYIERNGQRYTIR